MNSCVRGAYNKTWHCSEHCTFVIENLWLPAWLCHINENYILLIANPLNEFVQSLHILPGGNDLCEIQSRFLIALQPR